MATKYENFDNIKVDDEVVAQSSWGMRIQKVTKVSPKRFKVGGTSFNKVDGLEYGSGWHHDRCLHVTDELREEVARIERFAMMRHKLSNVRVDSYNYEQTKLLYDFMVEHSLIVED